MEVEPTAVPAPAPEVEADDQLTDTTRNWGPDVLLELVKIWRREVFAHPDWSRVQRMQNVYDAFRQTVDCSSRSRKAVDDKLYSMKQMYQFISKVNGNFMEGGPTKAQPPSWFELSKDERRAVRSLHRIKIPDISLEVYKIFDSVLSPAAVAARKAGKSNGATSTMATSQPSAGDGGAAKNEGRTTPTTEESQEILDVKRNWSYDVTLQLARVWNSVHKENPALRGATLSLNVYNAFMANVGGSNRSRKAVDDKMHSMKEMYRFMKAYETARLAGEDKIPWFDLTKPQRRAIRAANKIRVPNLAPDVFNEIDQLMLRMNQVSPGESVIDTSATSVPSVDLEGSQHNSSFAASAFAASGNVVIQSPGANRIATSIVTGARQSGQFTCECGAKRTLALVPVAGSSTGNSSSNSVQQLTGATSSVQTIQASTGSQGQDQGTPKRQRVAETSGLGSSAVDTQTARDFMEQVRLSLAQDREERRQQHAEQMSALRDIAELLKQRR